MHRRCVQTSHWSHWNPLSFCFTIFLQVPHLAAGLAFFPLHSLDIIINHWPVDLPSSRKRIPRFQKTKIPLFPWFVVDSLHSSNSRNIYIHSWLDKNYYSYTHEIWILKIWFIKKKWLIVLRQVDIVFCRIFTENYKMYITLLIYCLEIVEVPQLYKSLKMWFSLAK